LPSRRKRFAEEVHLLHELPQRLLDAMKREMVRVDSGSLIAVDSKCRAIERMQERPFNASDPVR